MKNLLLKLFCGILLSSPVLAAEYCVGQNSGASGYGSIGGIFTYHFWCSNGLYRTFNEYGCYTDKCYNKSRENLEKTTITQLGFKLLKITNVDQFKQKTYIYTEHRNMINTEKLDFAHNVVTHTGFATNPDRTKLYINKAAKFSEIDFGAADSADYLENLFEDYQLIKKITRDWPRRRLSELYILRIK